MYKKQKKALLNNRKKIWIFTGPKNEQKFKIAKDYATWILRDDKSLSDLLIIQKDKVKIEDTARVHDFVRLTTGRSKCKIVIIDNFHTATISASNSLLKILEEPKQDLIMIMIADNLYKILPTIRSRCSVLNFPAAIHDEKIIAGYRSILDYLADASKSRPVLDSETILLTFSRIIKFKHNILLNNEIFQGEFEELAKIKNDKVFWHNRHKKALKLINDCAEYNLNLDYTLNILFSDMELLTK